MLPGTGLYTVKPNTWKAEPGDSESDAILIYIASSRPARAISLSQRKREWGKEKNKGRMNKFLGLKKDSAVRIVCCSSKGPKLRSSHKAAHNCMCLSFLRIKYEFLGLGMWLRSSSCLAFSKPCV